jgi:hypothetical protein
VYCFAATKVLKPQLHDLALSMVENKTLNLKGITLLKLLQNIMLFFCVGNSSSVTI